jgi:hypothetical protein
MLRSTSPNSIAHNYLTAAVLAAVLLIAELITVARADPPASQPAASNKPPVRVTISKETTWITAPLREDGYPDYVRYLNETLSKGVTPENNAMVPLVRAMGLNDLDEEIRNEYCKLLGIDRLPKDGDYFETWSSYTARTPEAEQPRVPPGDERLQKDYFAQRTKEAHARPWTRNEFPHVAKWLDRNEQHLDAIVAGSTLPRFFAPLIVAPDDQFGHSMLLSALVVEVDFARDAAQALCCRAMLRVACNDSQSAASDLLAAHQLAAHLAEKPQLVNFLAAKQIECMARDGGIQLCALSPLPRHEIAEFRSRWKRFATIPTVARAFDIGSRLEHLDAICYIAREGWDVLRDVAAFITDLSGDQPSEPSKKVEWPRIISDTLTVLVRWDEPLKNGNEWHDRLVQIMRIEDSSARDAAIDNFDEDLRRVSNGSKQPPTKAGFYFYPRTIPTRLTSRVLLGLLIPPAPALMNSAGHALETNRSMFNLSMSLCEYRAGQKMFPETLGKLAPEYIGRIPVDDFGRREFVYRKTDTGFLLYSLGKNGRDDGGEGWSEQNEEADDVVIQVSAVKQ